jgi:glycerol uptake facilitator protein
MRTTKATLLNVALVGLLLAPVASSLQPQKYPRSRRALSTLKAISFENLKQRNGYQREEAKIPEDTSITKNPNVSTSDIETTRRMLERQNKPGWLSHILPSRAMLPEIVAESFGTFVLLHLVLGIVLSANIAGSMQGVFPIAILTGLGITAACTVVSSKCAAHFNPVITLAMCTYRNFGWNKFLPYLFAQLIGSTAACLANYAVYAAKIAQFEAKHGIIRNSAAGLQTAGYFGCYFADPITPLAAFLSEAFGVFTLTSVVFSLTSARNHQVKGLFIPPIIGSTVALIITIIGPITCASLNPARELGPRLVCKLFGWSSSIAFAQLPIYIAAAITGALTGGWFVDNVLYPDPNKTKRPAFLTPQGSFQ